MLLIKWILINYKIHHLNLKTLCKKIKIKICNCKKSKFSMK